MKLGVLGLIPFVVACSPDRVAAPDMSFHCAQVSDERGYFETDRAGNTVVELHFCDPPFSTASVFTALMAARQP